MADPTSPLIGYPPIKRVIKLEQETNSVEEGNWLHQLPKDPVEMADLPLIAYPPIKRTIKLEISDEHQEVNNVVEENWTLQLHKGSVQTTDNTTFVIDLPIANTSLSYEDSGKSKAILRGPPHPSRRDRQTAINALEEEEAQQETEATEEFVSEEEGFEYDQQSQKSEHSSLEDFDESDSSLAADSTDDEDVTTSPKAGPSKEQTGQVKKAVNNPQKRGDSFDHAAPKKGPFKCSKCEKSYSRKGSLTSHLKYDCGSEPQFPCTFCDRRYKRKPSLRMHLKTTHQIDQKQLDEHGAGLKKYRVLPFKCTKCDSSYIQKRWLDYHVKKECGVNFQCTICDQNYTRIASLRSHLLSIHKIAPRKVYICGSGFVDRPIHPYKCDQCERTYKQKRNLVRHLTTECGVNPSLSCPQCSGRYKHKSSLKLHMIEVHKVEHSQLEAFGLGSVIGPRIQLKCDRCGTSFKRVRYLKRHAKKCGV